MLHWIVLLTGVIAAQQGQVVRLSMPHEAGLQGVEIQWQDKTIPYIRLDNEWIAVLGIDLEQKPGDYASTITVRKNGVVERRDVSVKVQSVEFPTTQLTVDDRYVQLSPADERRAVLEAQEIAAIHKTVTKEMLWREPFVSPIEGGVGSNFGHRRVFNGQPKNPHTGADLRASTGTPIQSTNRGRVVLAKNLFYTGNTVMIDHGLGVYSLYAHLSRIDVKKGQMVERGQLLGLAGATGRVTGPHLHWGVRVQDARVDPFSLVNMK